MEKQKKHDLTHLYRPKFGIMTIKLIQNYYYFLKFNIALAF